MQIQALRTVYRLNAEPRNTSALPVPRKSKAPRDTVKRATARAATGASFVSREVGPARMSATGAITTRFRRTPRVF